MPGAAPPGYTEVLYWKLTGSRTRLILINLLSLPLALAAGAFFFWFATQFGRLVDVGVLHPVAAALVLVAAIVVTLGLHEVAHGAAMRAFGARPRYGVMPRALALYTTCPGFAFTRNQYLVVIFAPLVSVSLLAMLGMMLLAGTLAAYVLGLCATANAMGASGDVYMGWRVAQYPSRACVIDEADGMRVFMPAAPLPPGRSQAARE